MSCNKLPASKPKTNCHINFLYFKTYLRANEIDKFDFSFGKSLSKKEVVVSRRRTVPSIFLLLSLFPTQLFKNSFSEYFSKPCAGSETKYSLFFILYKTT